MNEFDLDKLSIYLWLFKKNSSILNNMDLLKLSIITQVPIVLIIMCTHKHYRTIIYIFYTIKTLPIYIYTGNRLQPQQLKTYLKLPTIVLYTDYIPTHNSSVHCCRSM